MSNEESSNGPLKYAVPIGLLIVGAVGCWLLTLLKSSPPSKDPKSQPPVVQTMQIADRTEGIQLSVDGVVAPYAEVTLSAEVAGQVTTKLPECFAGHFVERDTLLMQIDKADYELEERRVQTMVEQADISLAEADVEIENTKALIELVQRELGLQGNDLRRAEELLKRAIVTDSDLDAAKRNELVAQTALQTLQNKQALLEKRRESLVSERKRMGADLDKARLDVTRTTIRAPITGVITQDMVEAGAFVQRGTILAQLEDTSKVEVHFDLQMDQLQWIWQHDASRGDQVDQRKLGSYELPNLPVTVSLAVDNQGFHWQGRLARYNGAGVNSKTRTVPCVVLVDEPARLLVSDDEPLDLSAPPVLLRGMFVSIKMKIQPRIPLLSIPDAAVRPGNKIWLLRDASE